MCLETVQRPLRSLSRVIPLGFQDSRDQADLVRLADAHLAGLLAIGLLACERNDEELMLLVLEGLGVA